MAQTKHTKKTLKAAKPKVVTAKKKLPAHPAKQRNTPVITSNRLDYDRRIQLATLMFSALSVVFLIVAILKFS